MKRNQRFFVVNAPGADPRRMSVSVFRTNSPGILVLCVLLLCVSRSVMAENWPAWRGAAGTGIANEANLPTRFSSTDTHRVAGLRLCDLSDRPRKDSLSDLLRP